MFKNNQSRIMLCATTNGLLAGLWSGRKLQGNQFFANDETGHLAFTDFLKQQPETPVYLIADAVEEDYKLESLPHTVGNARRELVMRKLNQFYRRLNYRTAHFIDRAKDKRKDDNFLFVALNNDDFLQNWVAIIQSSAVPLVGIYLLPMLSQKLAQQLKLTSPHILLCEQLTSGLRQTYLHNGRLRMSRLVPNPPVDASKLGYFYLVEVEKTQLYLMSQRLISRETSMQLVLLSADGATQAISQAISHEQGLNCTDISLKPLAENLGLPLNLMQQMPALLHMQLLANGQLVDNLAPPALTRHFQLAKIKTAIKVSTVILSVLALLAAGLLFKLGFDDQSAYSTAQQDTLIMQHRYDEVAKNFPSTVLSATDLQAAVALDQTIANYPKSPRRMMQVVSAALEQAALEHIQLNRMRWVLSNDSNLKDDDKFMPSSVAPVAQNNVQAIATNPAQLNEVAFITAEIAEFMGDYRAALSNVHQLVASLRADQRVAQVEVLQEPVNVSSFVGLQGSTADEQSTQKQPAFFKLKVTLKPVNVAIAGVPQP
ncbi:MAG: hypothetical protein HOP21_05340 [Methylotenera sp.]|nr:hypothetical protein [Methylotenera sp.]